MIRRRRAPAAWLLLCLVGLGCSRSGLALPASATGDDDASQGKRTPVPAFKQDPARARADRIDLLFVIDNSGSMADKQALLIEAIPDMVQRLVRPRCVDNDGAPIDDQPARPELACPTGSAREFNSVQDMHVGVVTTAVGPMGMCMQGYGRADHAHLERPRPDYAYDGQPFVAWDPDGVKDPPGLSDLDQLNDALANLVARGTGGCPDEASLEAFYRFLIDPAPSARVINVPCMDGTGRRCLVDQGLDEALLAERARFVRPDSLLAIIVLSDESDCSLSPTGDGLRFATDDTPLARGTRICDDAPDDPCCHPCDTPAPAGCPAPETDPSCRLGPYTSEDDPILLRCWNQKARFGIERRHPIERYVRGLSQPTVPGPDGQPLPNPLFAERRPDGTPVRDASLVFFAAIVGVPWQDLAEDPFDPVELHYLSGDSLGVAGAWDTVIGRAETGLLPGDPLMHESLQERRGVQPVLGVPLQGSDADHPWANPINGHEIDLLALPDAPFRSDLQYACIFPLGTPRDCAGGGPDCDCSESPEVLRKPICQDERGRYSTTQWGAKAFPGVRQLQVAAALERNAIAASICARNATDRRRQDFGYRPALEALVDRLRLGLN